MNESKGINRITLLTIRFTNRFQTGTANDRVILSTAIGVLTQALIILDSNPNESIRLYNSALKLGALANGKKENEV